MFGKVRRVFGHSRLPFSQALLSSREDRTRTHNPQFVGHLTNSGFRTQKRWKTDGGMRRRQAAAAVAAWLFALLVAWVIVESAQALQIF